MAKLDVIEVSKSFDAKQVIDNISFSLSEGDRAVIVGKNGSGKSTLLELAAGLLAPDKGYAVYDGMKLRPNNAEAKRFLGFVAANPILIPSFTVKEYLCFCGKLHRLSHELTDRYVNELLAQFLLTEYAETRISHLSTGNKVLTSICAALLPSPHLLFLDEPFANLDPQRSAILSEELLRQSNRRILLIASQDIPAGLRVGNRFILLYDGKILKEWTLKTTSTLVLAAEIKRHFPTVAGKSGQ